MTIDPELDRLLAAKDAAEQWRNDADLALEAARDAQGYAEDDYYDACIAHKRYKESLK
jgi:hypothetical protein